MNLVAPTNVPLFPVTCGDVVRFEFEVPLMLDLILPESGSGLIIGNWKSLIAGGHAVVCGVELLIDDVIGQGVDASFVDVSTDRPPLILVKLFFIIASPSVYGGEILVIALIIL
jgi:hypothetical protein